MGFALTKDYIELMYHELETMPSARPTLDEYDRIAFAKRLACVTELHHFSETIVALRDRGGFRPSPSEFGDLVRRACGITEIDDLPPLQRAIYRTDRSVAAEAARLRQEQEGRLIEAAPGMKRGTSQISARDRTRAAIKALATRAGNPHGPRQYSYRPEEWNPVHPGDVDPLGSVPAEEYADLIAEAKTRTPSRHPRLLRNIAGKIWRERLSESEDGSGVDELDDADDTDDMELEAQK